MKQQLRHRPTNEVRTADDDRVPAREAGLVAVEQVHDSRWRTRPQAGQALGEKAPRSLDDRTVYIFGRRDLVNNGGDFSLRWQRQLDQSPIHRRCHGELPDRVEQHFLARVGRRRRWTSRIPSSWQILRFRFT